MKVVMYCRFWNKFWNLPDKEFEGICRSFPEIAFVNINNDEELEREIADAEIYFGYHLQERFLSAAKQLKWIHVAAANVFHFITPAFQERNLLLTNSRGMHATAIAEHVLGAMLVFSRKFMDCWRFQQQHQYAAIEILNEAPPLTELRGCTVMILGLGGIGKEVAKLCKAFGMRVLASKRTSRGPFEHVDELYGPYDFRKALPEADYLVVSMARTSDTEGLIGQAELALLKPQCVIINVARAGIIQQDWLLKALREKSIRGAALDVFDKEPLPENSELFALPNVFLTPHVAGVASREHWERLFALFEKNLRLYLQRKPLQNVVDMNAGY